MELNDFTKRVEEYMKCDKRTLAELLVLKEDLYNRPITFKQDTYPAFPWYNPACTDWAHCSNPHRDCINCPLRSYYTYTGGSSTCTYDFNKPKNEE